jgi:hypothetical protein
MPARVTGKPTARRSAPAVSATATDTDADTSAAPADPGAPSDPERIVLAVIDGIECTAPADVPFALSLQHLENAIRLKPVYADMRLVRGLIGETDYDRLLRSAITRDEWRHLRDAAAKHLLGAIEEEAPSGN